MGGIEGQVSKLALLVKNFLPGLGALFLHRRRASVCSIPAYIYQ